MSEQHLAFLCKLGKMLRVHYGRVVEEPLPHDLSELISAFYERDRLDQVRHAIRRDPGQPRLHERKLLIADRHIVDGERRIAEQRVRISRLRKSGLDTREARRLLHKFEEILREMFRHRAMIVQQIREGH